VKIICRNIEFAPVARSNNINPISFHFKMSFQNAIKPQ